MATMVWAGGSGNWTTAANWIGGVAPQQDDNLIFPATPTSVTSVNDFASGTRFRSVTVSGSTYTITGAPISLLEGFVYNASAGGASFTPAITLGAAQTFYSANDGATITLGASFASGGSVRRAKAKSPMRGDGEAKRSQRRVPAAAR